MVIGNETVTGELVGITITGDLIKANTIVADKFVLKGQNGLFYRINTDGITVETEQTDENSLNGKVILAKSITADKVKVTDLVAFGATIAGFNINDDSIYSGVKESVNNNTRGIYLDKDGQIAFGDSNNYVKYYKDTDNTYKLKISAGSIIMSATGKTVEDAINGVETKLNEMDIPDNVVTKADLIDDINSELKIDGKSISLTTGHFVINSKNFSLDAAGNASFSGTIKGSAGEFTKGFFVDIPTEYGSYNSSWRISMNNNDCFFGWYHSGLGEDGGEDDGEANSIADMTDDEAMKILQLTPVDFDYIEAYGGEKNQHGLIAEDTIDIIPSCVTVPDGYSEDAFDIDNGIRNEVLAIDYSKLVPYLVKMIQIQQKQIDKLLSTQQKGE